MSHFIQKCSCGAVIAQCRCMAPDKTVEVIQFGCAGCKAKLAEYKVMDESSDLTPAAREAIENFIRERT